MKSQLNLQDIGVLAVRFRGQTGRRLAALRASATEIIRGAWLEPVDKFFEIVLPIEKMSETIYTS